LIGYGLYTLSLRFIEAGKSSITLTIEPGAAIILAYLFVGESVTQIQLLGTALIVSGVIVLQLKGWERLNSTRHYKTESGSSERAIAFNIKPAEHLVAIGFGRNSRSIQHWVRKCRTTC